MMRCIELYGREVAPLVRTFRTEADARPSPALGVNRAVGEARFSKEIFASQLAHTAAGRAVGAGRGLPASTRTAGEAANATMRSSMKLEASRVVRLWSEPGMISTVTLP